MKDLPVSKLVKKQVITKIVEGFRVEGGHGKLVIKIRYDDQCGNKHNSFAITGSLYRDNRELSCGCLHDDIREFAPEYAHLIKWHLTSSDGPMHYVANTTYHAKEVNKNQHFVYLNDEVTGIKRNLLGLFNDERLKEVQERFKDFQLDVRTEPTSDSKKSDINAARNCAIWPDATLEQLQDEKALNERLPALMDEFKSVIESLGMEY